jgi:hypothetical protein
LATADGEQMTEVIREYGEERFAFQVAKAIDARRQERGPLATTSELAELVARTVKTREPGQDPATRTFQALRIFVNAELEELQEALEASLHVLQPHGRLVVIAFHSLEDRIVKQFIARHSRDEVDRRAPFRRAQADEAEGVGAREALGRGRVKANPRSRSAIMRVAERTAVLMMRINILLLVTRDGERALPGAGAVRVAPPVCRDREARRTNSAQARSRERAAAGREAARRPRRRGCSKLAREQLQMRAATPAITQYVTLKSAARTAGAAQ